MQSEGRRGISGVISDLDGTLLETEELKALSHARAVRELRPEVAEEDVTTAYDEHYVGRSRREVTEGMISRFDLADTLRDHMKRAGEGEAREPWEYLIDVRHAIYEEILSDPDLLLSKRYPHNIDLLEKLKSEGYPLALATMSYRHQVDRILGVLGLEDLFDEIVTADDIRRGKPDPEIDLLAAERLGFSPKEIVVLEDSAAGIEAAVAAGMAVVAVPTYITKKSVLEAGLPESRWIVSSPEDLERVFRERVAAAGGGNPEKP
ncbi:MAG: HAD family hydrolase [Rubrobacter sp.]